MWYTCFVANRNLTLSLPEELVRRAKIMQPNMTAQ